MTTGMSIQKNVGGVAALLARHHLRPTYLSLKTMYRHATDKIPGGKAIYKFNHRIKKAIKGNLLPSSFFEDMGFTYIGSVDGHQVGELTQYPPLGQVCGGTCAAPCQNGEGERMAAGGGNARMPYPRCVSL